MKHSKILSLILLFHASYFCSYGQYAFETFLAPPNPFHTPIGMVVDKAGKIYVVDADNNRVLVFNANRSFDFAFGSMGSGNGQFNNPTSIAIDEVNNFLYVTDRANWRVQKFTKQGAFVAIIGGIDPTGNTNGLFGFTSGIAVDNAGNIYVSDSHRIQKFNSAGAFVAKIMDINQSPDHVIDSQGNLFITDWYGNRIIKADLQGNIISQYATGSPNVLPQGIGVDNNGQLYVTMVGASHTIYKFTNDLEFINSFGTSGSGDGQFNYAGDVAIDANGYAYISDMFNNRVHIFKPYPVPEITVLFKGVEIADAASHDFGATEYGTPVDHTFEISNMLGFGELTLNTLTLPTGFSLIGDFPSSVAPNTKKQFTIRFNASSVGDFSGSLSFVNNDPDESPFQITLTGSVTKAHQFIKIDSIPGKTFGDKPFKLMATNSSSLPITFSISLGHASISKDSLSITGAGPVTVTAFNPGNENYLPASGYRQFIVVRASQTIAFDSIPDHVLADSPITLHAVASSGLLVLFNIKTGPAYINAGNQLSFYRTGGVTVEASQSGNENFEPAPSRQHYFEVSMITGVEQFQTDRCTAFPNPASEAVTIQPCSSEEFSGTLSDIHGVTVKTFVKTEREQTIDLRDLAAGVYILKIATGSQIFAQLIVKK